MTWGIGSFVADTNLRPTGGTGEGATVEAGGVSPERPRLDRRRSRRFAAVTRRQVVDGVLAHHRAHQTP